MCIADDERDTTITEGFDDANAGDYDVPVGNSLQTYIVGKYCSRSGDCSDQFDSQAKYQCFN